MKILTQNIKDIDIDKDDKNKKDIQEKECDNNTSNENNQSSITLINNKQILGITKLKSEEFLKNIKHTHNNEIDEEPPTQKLIKNNEICVSMKNDKKNITSNKCHRSDKVNKISIQNIEKKLPIINDISSIKLSTADIKAKLNKKIKNKNKYLEKISMVTPIILKKDHTKSRIIRKGKRVIPLINPIQNSPISTKLINSEVGQNNVKNKKDTRNSLSDTDIQSNLKSQSTGLNITHNSTTSKYDDSPRLKNHIYSVNNIINKYNMNNESRLVSVFKNRNCMSYGNAIESIKSYIIVGQNKDSTMNIDTDIPHYNPNPSLKSKKNENYFNVIMGNWVKLENSDIENNREKKKNNMLTCNIVMPRLEKTLDLNAYTERLNSRVAFSSSSKSININNPTSNQTSNINKRKPDILEDKYELIKKMKYSKETLIDNSNSESLNPEKYGESHCTTTKVINK